MLIRVTCVSRARATAELEQEFPNADIVYKDGELRALDKSNGALLAVVRGKKIMENI